MLILLTVCHTFHVFLLEFKRFPELSRTSSPFPGLSNPGKLNATIKFQDFPGFPGPVRTLLINFSSRESSVFRHVSASRLRDVYCLKLSEDLVEKMISPVLHLLIFSSTKSSVFRRARVAQNVFIVDPAAKYPFF